MTIEARVAYLEALLANLHKLPRGLGLETVFDHPAALSIGTTQPIAGRFEAGDGGAVDPSVPQRAVYGTCETNVGAPANVGLSGNATNGAVNVGVEGRYQRVGAVSAALVGREIAGDGTELTRISISPYGFVAESVAQGLPSFDLSAGGWTLKWEDGHLYWHRPDGSRVGQVQGT